MVRFTRAADDARAWDGAVPAEVLAEVERALLARHGQPATARQLARLMREAGEIYTEALHGRH